MKYLLIVLLVAASCSVKKKKEYGSVSGNVFWKYNNFVGNRADASAKVYLYSIDDSTLTFTATADIRGDYRIDSIPTGQYLLIVSSESTTDSPMGHYRNLKNQQNLFERLAKKEYGEAFEVLSHKVQYFDSLKDETAKDYNKYLKYNDSANHYAGFAISVLPYEILMKSKIFGEVSNKVQYKMIDVKTGRSETIITDFGTTYL